MLRIRRQVSRNHRQVFQESPSNAPGFCKRRTRHLARLVRMPIGIRGVGAGTSDMLVGEAFFRDLRDRWTLALYGGLTGSPDESSTRHRERGLVLVGNARVRQVSDKTLERHLPYRSYPLWDGVFARHAGLCRMTFTGYIGDIQQRPWRASLPSYNPFRLFQAQPVLELLDQLGVFRKDPRKIVPCTVYVVLRPRLRDQLDLVGKGFPGRNRSDELGPYHKRPRRSPRKLAKLGRTPARIRTTGRAVPGCRTPK